MKIIEADDFMCNFYLSPIVKDGLSYPTVEHLFQSQKTLDLKEAENIRLQQYGGKAKDFGGRCSLREDWEDIKFDVMLDAIRLKFSQNPSLAEMLVNTGDAIIVEPNNWHDNTWGNCSCSFCFEIEGQELLGKILMMVRYEIK